MRRRAPRRSSQKRWLLALAGSVLTTLAAHAAYACEAPRRFETGGRVESSGLIVIFRTVPAPIEVGRHFKVEAVVCPRASGAMPTSVRVDAYMPEHRHGMNYRPTVVKGSDDIYVADGLLFHMPGLWQLRFDVERDGRVERLSADIELE